MKKILSATLLLAAVILFAKPARSQIKHDLTGTWEGVIYIGTIDIDMEMTFTLLEKEGVLTGRITDDWGFIDCDIAEPRLEDGILTFKALVETASDDHQMAFRMTVSGPRMEGQWESQGSFGNWTATKKSSDDAKKKRFEAKDLVGEWTGPAAFKSSPGSKNVLTLILKEKNGELYGTFSDQMGTPYDHPVIKDLSGEKLVFEVSFPAGESTFTMDMNMTLKSGSSMRGKFSIPGMKREGIWKAEKKEMSLP